MNALDEICEVFEIEDPVTGVFHRAIRQVEDLTREVEGDPPVEDFGVHSSHFWCYVFGDIADSLDPAEITPDAPSAAHFAKLIDQQQWIGQGYSQFVAAHIAGAMLRKTVQRGVETALVLTGLDTVRSAALALQVLVCPDVSDCKARSGVHKEIDGLMQDGLAAALAEEVRGRVGA